MNGVFVAGMDVPVGADPVHVEVRASLPVDVYPVSTRGFCGIERLVGSPEPTLALWLSSWAIRAFKRSFSRISVCNAGKWSASTLSLALFGLGNLETGPCRRCAHGTRDPGARHKPVELPILGRTRPF